MKNPLSSRRSVALLSALLALLALPGCWPKGGKRTASPPLCKTPACCKTWLQGARARLLRSEPAASSAYLAQALRACPGQPALLSLAGHAYAQQGDSTAAQSALQQLVDLGAAEQDDLALLGSLYDVQRAYPQALAVYTLGEQRFGPCAFALELASSLLLADQPAAALAPLQRAATCPLPTGSEAQLLLGLAYLRAGQFADSARALQDLAQRGACPARCYSWLARAEAYQGRHPAAQQALVALQKLTGNGFATQLLRAQLLLEGDSPQAQQAAEGLAQLVAAKPQPSASLLALLVHAWLLAGDEAAAAAAWQSLLARIPAEQRATSLDVQLAEQHLRWQQGQEVSLSELEALALARQGRVGWRVVAHTAERAGDAQRQAAAREALARLP